MLHGRKITFGITNKNFQSGFNTYNNPVFKFKCKFWAVYFQIKTEMTLVRVLYFEELKATWYKWPIVVFIFCSVPCALEMRISNATPQNAVGVETFVDSSNWEAKPLFVSISFVNVLYFLLFNIVYKHNN